MIPRTLSGAGKATDSFGCLGAIGVGTPSEDAPADSYDAVRRYSASLLNWIC
jgi:hypothetical protein